MSKQPPGLAEAPVTLYEGLPGSGKSLRAVMRTMEWITVRRQPVYTDLPLRSRLIRRWVRARHGEAVAGLLHPMSPETVQRCIERAALYVREKQAAQAIALESGERLAHRKFVEGFFERHGPHVTAGPGTNWWPAGSLIVLDEVHRMFPAQAKSETPDLAAYATMVRHFDHTVVLITQNRMYLSLTWRRVVGQIWHVRNMHNERGPFGIPWGKLGLSALAYDPWDPHDERGSSPQTMGLRPGCRLVFPKWPPKWAAKLGKLVGIKRAFGVRWYFRLYDSHTVTGRESDRRRELRDARIASGLDASGADVEAERRRVPTDREINMGTLRWLGRGAVAAGVLAIGVGIGTTMVGPAVGAAEGESEEVDEHARVIDRWREDGVRVNGRWIGIGEQEEGGWRLAAVRPGTRRSVWLHGFEVAIERRGVWEHVGNVEQVAERVEAAKARIAAERAAADAGG